MLVISCVAAAAVALVSGDALDGWQSQLLWLTVNVAVVTLVLEALLEMDLTRRRRDSSRLGFQVNTAMLVHALQKLAGADPPATGGVFTAIGTRPQDFAAHARTYNDPIASVDDVAIGLYDELYPKVNGVLTDLQRNFVRHFSGDADELVANFTTLAEVALRWRHRYALQPMQIAHAEETPDGDPLRLELAHERGEVLELLRDTSATVSDILARSERPLMELAP